MDARAVAAFLESPYNTVVDAKMWLFFAAPSRLTVAVIGVLVVGSIFVRDLWCRYLCPYGALLGVLGRLAPLKVTRDEDLCTGCEGCTRACPARCLSIACSGWRRSSARAARDCVVACR
jgi:polyferredoxin